MKSLCLLASLCLLSIFSFATPSISYTQLQSTCSSGNVTLSNVIISDASATIQTNGNFAPKIFYRKGANGAWFNQPGTLANGQWSFTIVMTDMGTVAGDVIEYFVAAQNTATNPEVASYPTGIVAGNMNSISTYPTGFKFVAGGMGGTYTIGANKDFSTIASAITAYNTACLNSAVEFLLTDANYTVTSALEITNSQTSATKTLTIKPANGVTATINGNVPQQLFRILSSFVTIDGNNGSADRQLTIVNNSVAVPNVFGIFSTGSNVVSDITIKNAILINGARTNSVIHMSDRFDFAGLGYFKNVKINNNSIQKGSYGISAYLSTGAGYGTGFEVKGNDLSASGANAIKTVGILFNGIDGGVISNNMIGNFNSTDDENDVGIMLLTGAKNTVVEGNKISNIHYTGTNGWGAQGIYIKSEINNNDILVVNNFISNVSGDGYAGATNNPIGIALSGNQSGTKIYHNTIHLNGNTIYYTSALSAGIYLGSGSSASIVNNIIVNNLGQKTGAPTGGFAPIGAAGIAASSKTQFTALSNNNYWVSPTGSGAKNIGRIGSIGYNTIDEWQTASGETNAKNIQPVFVSADDLHLVPASNAALDNLGLPIGVTTDIDNNTRGTIPDIGAAEFTGPCIAPSIATQPVAITTCAGTNATFSVVASGTGLSYQWRKNGTDINGATNANITLNNISVNDAANYDVVVTGACGNVTSTAVALTVNTAPAITKQPIAQTICSGENVTFSVEADGTGLTYKWRKNGTEIPNATNSSYTITGATASDAGNYDVIVSGTCPGDATSNAVALSINSKPVIATQPTAQKACSGGSATFTVSASGQSISYQWRKNGTDISGATTSSFTLNNISAADEANYDVVVTNTCGNTTSTAVDLTLNAATNITAHPQGLTACHGNGVTFSVTATGTNLTYKWMKNGNLINGATNSSFTIDNVTSSDAGNYSVEVSGCTAVKSNVATLSIPTTNTWLGTVNTDWNNAANWCLGVPTENSDIVLTAGTAFQPTISVTTAVRNLTISNGVTLTLSPSGVLNLHGNLINNGTFTANAGTMIFKGSSNQNIAAITVGSAIVNGQGGITLTGNMNVSSALTLTNGNITLGANNITLNGSVSGSTASHIITNGTGSVTSNNINANAVVVPVAPNATSYNPVTIANGGGRNYTVSVNEGIIPAIAVNNRAINRTWKVIPNSASANNADITLQYVDAEANSAATPGGVMEIGLHNGNSWIVISPSSGVTPTSGSERKVTFATNQFGPLVITTPGGISYPTSVSTINGDISKMQLLPNIINGKSVLRINAKKAMKIDFVITDMNGRTVLQFSKQIFTGQNDIPVTFDHLSNGVYQIKGATGKELTEALRFIKM